MQLQYLTYFVAVAETRHFTRAAERVNVSQPALSKQIATLERELGAELFSRARGNITLTAAGEALLPLARRILADVDTATREVQELAQLRRGRVRLGATPSVCTGLLPTVLRDFHRSYPGIQLLVQETGSGDLVRELSAGSLDVALVIPSAGTAADERALVVTPVLVEELIVASSFAVPAPAARGDGLRLPDLDGVPLVMFRHGYDLRTYTMTACHRAGFEPTIAIEGGEMDAVLGFVAAGLGAAVVPATVVAHRTDLRVTPFAPPGPSRVVALAHRRDVRLPRAAAELRSTLLSYLDTEAAAGTLPPRTRRYTDSSAG
ncbi:LysR family transcriptional regulator [Fodinicola acaciae]|uniref:LysR family transcriptional regulator n=1 Tax=Fodinicola acaciae TaxID=2681555 RepID=UPI0013D2E933|nr:LysR family transcriptional regulator [Fodinicola acaciae]